MRTHRSQSVSTTSPPEERQLCIDTSSYRIPISGDPTEEPMADHSNHFSMHQHPRGSSPKNAEKEPLDPFKLGTILESKFINQFFPTSKTERIFAMRSPFQQRMETFDKMPLECLKIIESKSKVRTTRANCRILSELLLDKKKPSFCTHAPAPAPLSKAVELSVLRCGGGHSTKTPPLNLHLSATTFLATTGANNGLKNWECDWFRTLPEVDGCSTYVNKKVHWSFVTSVQELELEQKLVIFCLRAMHGQYPLVQQTSDETSWVEEFRTLLGKQQP
ncbi:hypothetical protein Tco_0903446 [Tanacetum coccineum]